MTPDLNPFSLKYFIIHLIAGWLVYMLFIRRLAHRRKETDMRAVLSNDARFTPGRLLGFGREGVVFALVPDRAIKIIFSRTDRDPKIEREEHKNKLDVIRENGLDAPPFIVGIHELGEIYQSGDAYPFQICEKIEGRTLRDELKTGSLRRATTRERLTRLVELIVALERLAVHDLHFVHIDDCNLMVDTQGRWRLIDFDALELGKQDFAAWRRELRRLCRVILAVVGNDWKSGHFGQTTSEVQNYFARLKTLANTGKKVWLDEKIIFHSLAEVRTGLEQTLAALTDPSPAR